MGEGLVNISALRAQRVRVERFCAGVVNLYDVRVGTGEVVIEAVLHGEVVALDVDQARYLGRMLLEFADQAAELSGVPR